MTPLHVADAEAARDDDAAPSRGIDRGNDDVAPVILGPAVVVPRRRVHRAWLVVGLFLVAAAVVVAARPHKGPDTASTLHTVAVRRGTIVDAVVATGTMEPKTTVEIKSKINGIVTRWLVDAGDPVTEGQVVAELDKEVADARVKEARANVLAARARTDQARAETTSAERDYARQELRRHDELRRTGVVSAAELDKAKRDYEVGETRYESAQANLRVAAAQVAQAEAMLDRAENELRYATITSPLTGIVLARDIDVGSGVSAVGSSAGFGTTLMTIGDVSELHIVGQVDEVDIGKVHVGQPARVRVESFPGRTFRGEVTKIAPQGHDVEKVVSFEVKVKIVGDSDGLRPKMTADAEIIIAEKADVLLVPEAAVTRGTDGATVQRVTPGTTQPDVVPVTLGIGNGADVEVMAGLDEGTLIVGP